MCSGVPSGERHVPTTAAETRSQTISASVVRRLREDEGELVAAPAEARVVLAQAGAQDLADRHQAAIAGGVAEAVVDVLEAVEVGDDDRQRGAAAAHASDLGGEGLDERAAVGQAGQLVVAGLVLGPVAAVDEPEPLSADRRHEPPDEQGEGGEQQQPGRELRERSADAPS